MSRSPQDEASGPRKRAEYRDVGLELDRLAQAGVSWSGHERNRCFLNTRHGRFADASAAVGFDQLDDGRSLALVDWDHDGDLDVWSANRTGPRLRFLRNDLQSDSRFVALRLVGKGTSRDEPSPLTEIEPTEKEMRNGSNRDAVGARVTITLANDEQTKLIKTVRAGEGFLGQSSKWLHFGLGTKHRIASVTVRWPGGTPESISGVEPNGHFQVVEGSGVAMRWEPPRRVGKLNASIPQVPAEGGRSRLFLASSLPLPRLEYETLDGECQPISALASGPLLVNLWGPSCLPCRQELAELTLRASQLRSQQVDVLALAVESDPAKLADVRDVLRLSQFPFHSGIAHNRLVEAWELVHHFLLKPHQPLPIPTSFLVDTDGRLAAIYRGPVDVDQLLRDVSNLETSRPQRISAGLPFTGTWFTPPPPRRLMPLAAMLAERGFLEEALEYARQEKLTHDEGYPELLSRVGRERLRENNAQAALTLFAEAHRLRPDQADSHYNLAIALAELEQRQQAIEHLRQAIRIDPNDFQSHNNLGNLLLQSGAEDLAIERYRSALALEPDLADVHYNLANVLLQRKDYDEAKAHYEQAIRIDPGHAHAHHNLGTIEAARGNTEPALQAFRMAVRLHPGYGQAHYNLANLLMAVGSSEDAVKQYRLALDTSGGQTDAQKARIHHSLGGALAAQRQWSDALLHLRKAVEDSPGAPTYKKSLAWVLATNPAGLGDAAETVQLAEEAAEATKRRSAHVLDTLAAAYAAAGKYDQAAATAQEAARLARQANDDRHVEKIRKRWELYRQSKPFRLPDVDD